MPTKRPPRETNELAKDILDVTIGATENISELTTKLIRVFRKHSVSLILLWSSFHSVRAQSADIVKAVQRAKNTVAPLVCMVRDAQTGTKLLKFRVIGTAFMIDEKGTFITADHIISDITKPPWSTSCVPTIVFPNGGWKREVQTVQWFAFDIAKCQVNERWDVAACKTEKDLSKETTVTYDG